MKVDLRCLPSREIWYRAKTDKWYPGRLLDLQKYGQADLVLESGDWGVTYPIYDKPYGKEKEGHWYFKDPSPEALALLERIETKIGPEDHIPAWQSATPVAVLSPEFVENVVATALEEKRDHKNGDYHPREKRVGVSTHSKGSKAS